MCDKPTHRKVWNIAAPMILSNLTVPLLGMVDTAVVGHLPQPHYLGAVAVGSMIFGVVFWGFGFLRMGTTGLTAQALGALDYAEIRALLIRALLVALSFALLLLLLQGPIAALAFDLMRPSEIVEQQARLYFDIRIFSAPATLCNYVLIGWFLGLQNARLPLLLLVTVNSINMLLDVLFVQGWGLAADGVAWASLIAEYCACALGFWLVKRQLQRYPAPWHRELIFDRVKFRAMLLLNQNIFIRTLCLMFSLAFFTAQGARMGDAILAANAVLFNFYTFMAYGLDGFAHAAEALTGKAVGQKQQQAFMQSVHSAGAWALLVSIVFALIYGFLGEAIITLLTDIEVVQSTAEQYLIWLILLPLISVWSFTLDGIFIGATRSVEMRNSMLVATIVVFIPAWYLLQPWANHGLWLAYSLFMLARAVTMAWLFVRINRKAGFVYRS